MNNIENVIGMSIMLFGTVLIIGFAVAIWKYKNLGLISGYKENKVKDKNGLAKWIGVNLLIMAAYNTITALILLYDNGKLIDIVLWIYSFIIIVQIIVIIIGSRIYYKD